MIHNLSGGDITKMDQVLQMPIMACFTLLSYNEDLNFIQNG